MLNVSQHAIQNSDSRAAAEARNMVTLPRICSDNCPGTVCRQPILAIFYRFHLRYNVQARNCRSADKRSCFFGILASSTPFIRPIRYTGHCINAAVSFTKKLEYNFEYCVDHCVSVPCFRAGRSLRLAIAEIQNFPLGVISETHKALTLKSRFCSEK